MSRSAAVTGSVSDGRVRSCIAQLEKHVQGEVYADRYRRLLYSTDASIYQVEPYAVVFPMQREDIQAVVETAGEYGVPVLARAAGSSLAGQAVGEAIIVDVTRHLDNIVRIDPDRKTVTCEPGVVLDHLNNRLAQFGLQFGPDPASSNRAAMGGIVSNNSTGSHSIAYGMTADHVRSMRVVLDDGSRSRLHSLDAEQLDRRCGRQDRDGAMHRALRDLTDLPHNARIIREQTPRHWRRCGGYNLDRLVPEGINFHGSRPSGFNPALLMCGAEGTLGVIEEVTLSLVDRPKHTALAVIHFGDLKTALRAVPLVLETNPSAVELLDHLGMQMCRRSDHWRRKLETFVDGDPECLLVTEYSGHSARHLKSLVESLKDHLARRRAGADTIVPVLSREGQQTVWGVRKMGLGFLMSVPGDHKPIPFIEDAAVPVEHLADYVTSIERFCSDRDIRIAYYAHASAGCVHIRPLINAKDAKDIRRMPEIVDFAVEQLKGYGGALSSEHGDGRARSAFNEQFFGPDLYGLYREVKQIFDPDHLFNPGNIVDAGPMTENLRFGRSYETLHIDTKLDFSDQLGFDRAVEMCNGAGVCRKLGAGTMCPSFMATREEEHSTRGRANALRAVLSGRLPSSELTGDRLYKTLDLCLQCKACAAECPSSVDMARLKVEFLAQYYQKNGIPRRARLFGHVAEQARRLSGRRAALVNAIAGSRVGRMIGGLFAGLAPERTPPPFASEPFDQWFAGRRRQKLMADGAHHTSGTGAAASPGTNTAAPDSITGAAAERRSERKRVVLFNDTFNTYFYPEVARAAVHVLETAGFDVLLPGHGCCGRPMISKGLVDDARAAASETLDKLAPYAREGIPIVGLEPSCILSFGDEYPALLPGDDRTATVADHAVLFDDFIRGLAADGSLELPAMTGPGQVLVHGHCHQKSAIGTEGTHGALGLMRGAVVSEVDSGCCGMAGSFGFEKEHYDISMAIGEQRLFPAVRETGEETVVVACGVSCRQQILHGTGRRAKHTAEVLSDAISAAESSISPERTDLNG